MDKNFLKLLLALTGLGSLVDGYMTMITLLYLFQARNLLAYAFAFIGGLFVWVLTANLKTTFLTAPVAIKIIGVVAIMIDFITSYVGSTYFVALGYSFSTPINWSNVWCCDYSNIPRTLAAFGLAISFNMSTISVVGIWNDIRN